VAPRWFARPSMPTAASPVQLFLGPGQDECLPLLPGPGPKCHSCCWPTRCWRRQELSGGTRGRLLGNARAPLILGPKSLGGCLSRRAPWPNGRGVFAEPLVGSGCLLGGGPPRESLPFINLPPADVAVFRPHLPIPNAVGADERCAVSELLAPNTGVDPGVPLRV
jgi:hypothetical protein